MSSSLSAEDIDVNMMTVRQRKVAMYLHSICKHRRESRGGQLATPDPSEAADEARLALEESEELTWLWTPIIHECCARADHCSITMLLASLPHQHPVISSLLLHPDFVRHLHDVWNRGLPPVSTDMSGPLLRRLDSSNRPWMSHCWSLLSYLGLLGLTVSLAVRPATGIGPGTLRSAPLFSVREVSWLVLAFAHLLQVSARRRWGLGSQILPLLPTMAVVLLLFNPFINTATGATYSFLCISIFPLCLRLVFTTSPSLALLAPSGMSHLLPLSTTLQSMVGRGLQAAILIAPLALVIFGLFSWALNGDVFRGFFVINLITPVARRLGEDSVAPFEARAVLALTLVALLTFLLALVFARMVVPVHGTNYQDDWASSFGPATACAARQALLRAIFDSGIGLTVRNAGTHQLEASPSRVVGYGAISNTAASSERPFQRVETLPPVLVPPFNVLGFVVASVPAFTIRVVLRQPATARRYGRLVTTWIWRATTGWLSWIVITAVEDLFVTSRSLSAQSLDYDHATMR